MGFTQTIPSRRHECNDTSRSTGSHGPERRPRQDGARLPRLSHPREDLRGADQAPGQPGRPEPGLFPRRGNRQHDHPRRRRIGCGQVHLARQPGGRGHQRHRRARPGQHRPAGGQTRHGRQGLPVQEIRRHRRLRHRAERERPGQAGRHHRRAGTDAGRDQSGRHQGARMLLHREEAARAHEDPRLPRRPARHRHHLLGRRPERPEGRGQGHRSGQTGVLGRGRRRHRLPGPHGQARRLAKEHLRGRFARRDLGRPRREDGAQQGPLRPEDRRPYPGRRLQGRRRVPGLFGPRRADPGHGAHHGRPSADHGPGQPRPRDPSRGRQGRPARLHHRHRPFGLPEPGQQRAVLSLHLPGRDGLRRHRHQ